MPTYDFECSNCGHQDEIIQSMSADSTKDCPACDAKASFTKVFLTAPTAFVKGEPTTIGQWADKNTKALGRYERQAKEIQDEANKYMSPEAKERQAMHKKINNMSGEQKQKWIMEGD
jgi:putative FmdB family regulatory protein